MNELLLRALVLEGGCLFVCQGLCPHTLTVLITATANEGRQLHEGTAATAWSRLVAALRLFPRALRLDCRGIRQDGLYGGGFSAPRCPCFADLFQHHLGAFEHLAEPLGEHIHGGPLAVGDGLVCTIALAALTPARLGALHHLPLLPQLLQPRLVWLGRAAGLVGAITMLVHAEQQSLVGQIVAPPRDLRVRSHRRDSIDHFRAQ
mmetsp:Transcript_19624/g.60954  ORF Transcript_19624/g.60954 Transcript_19624/m.60954 type:complete len:205 (+) Transcript_19624:1491-2105(+)